MAEALSGRLRALASAPAGSVAVRWETSGDDLVVTWAEHGGPVVATPKTDGFGASLIQKTVTRQFRGALEHDSRASGPSVKITLPLEQIVA